MPTSQQPDCTPSANPAEGVPSFPPIPVNAIPHQLWDVLFTTFRQHGDLIAWVRRNIENTGSPMVNACAVLNLLTAASNSARNQNNAPPEMEKLEALFQSHTLLDWSAIRIELEGRWTPEMVCLIKLVYAIVEALGETQLASSALSQRMHELAVCLDYEVLPTSDQVRKIIREEVSAAVRIEMDKFHETQKRRENTSRFRNPLTVAAITFAFSFPIGAGFMLAMVGAIAPQKIPQPLAYDPNPSAIAAERRDDGDWVQLPDGTWKPIKRPIADKRTVHTTTPPKPNP